MSLINSDSTNNIGPSRVQNFLYHPLNGNPVPIYEGFSWPALLFGAFWFLFKGMWIWAAIIFLAAIVSAGIGWVLSLLIIPFIANDQHQKHLLNQGYQTSPPSGEPGSAFSEERESSAQNENSTNQGLENLKKLAQLRDDGILTEEEFEEKKKSILEGI